MAKKSSNEPAVLLPREFTSEEQIDIAIRKLQRRIAEVDALNAHEAIMLDNGADDIVVSNVRETIRDVFGDLSPEFREHQYLRMWAGPMHMGMGKHAIAEATQKGQVQVRAILAGLISRLEEKRLDLVSDTPPSPSGYFDKLQLHPRILDVARDQFLDGYAWEAVFAAAKALVNYVKERSGRHDIDGTNLMRVVFSKNNPVLAFNDSKDQTDHDEQEGMMHLFEGAVMAIRNPGGHAFPEGSEQRAIEYISFLSLLAYRVQEAKRIRAAK